MEKLIELFNEYERPQTNHIYTAYEVKENMNRLDILQEFIKWLVDNDKIDVSYKKHWENRPYKLHQFSGKAEKYSSYDTILMLLAIQDSPLDFLISILK